MLIEWLDKRFDKHPYQTMAIASSILGALLGLMYGCIRCIIELLNFR